MELLGAARLAVVLCSLAAMAVGAAVAEVGLTAGALAGALVVVLIAVVVVAGLVAVLAGVAEASPLGTAAGRDVWLVALLVAEARLSVVAGLLLPLVRVSAALPATVVTGEDARRSCTPREPAASTWPRVVSVAGESPEPAAATGGSQPSKV